MKGAKKKLTIIGNSVEREDGTKFEYIAVPHPEGFINSETMFLFDFEEISSIDFIGFVNAEFQMMSNSFTSSEIESSDPNNI